MKHSLQDSIDPILKPVLDRVEGLLDTYLPKAQAKAQEAEAKAEGVIEDAADQAPASKQEVEQQAKRVVDMTFSLLDRSTNAAKNTVHFGFARVADVTAVATDYVQWSVQNPSKVPEAALQTVQAGSATIRERVDGTVEITRKNAHSLTDLAFHARDTALNVFENEKKSAPKDQPRGLLITGINTVLVLTGKSLDQAKHYFQDSKATDSAKDTLSEATDKVQGLSDEAGNKLDEVLPEEKTVKKTATKAKEQTHQTAKQASQSIEDILHKEHANK